jgi:tetratricopeptide (TPR) repeat protein
VDAQQGNASDKVRADLEKGVQFGGNAVILYELDKLDEAAGVSPEKRLGLLESHESVVNRDDIIARQINLEIFAGKYDVAIQLIQSRFFRRWEGGGRFSLGDSWINAHVLSGRRHLAGGQAAQALADFQAARQFPASLQEATGNVAGRAGEICYWIGTAQEALGLHDAAKQSWRQAAGLDRAPAMGDVPAGFGGGFGRGDIGGLGAGVRVPAAAPYYQAMALEKLGQGDRAKVIFQQLIEAGAKTAGGSLEQVADGHYVAGLGLLGMNDVTQAREEFGLALKARPDHLAAATAILDH